uniref:Uncharacterized protein n=1 Tax=Octopus bimaculoides TaxID=37653 RepID=A0A0L8I4J8_OCTBM
MEFFSNLLVTDDILNNLFASNHSPKSIHTFFFPFHSFHMTNCTYLIFFTRVVLRYDFQEEEKSPILK